MSKQNIVIVGGVAGGMTTAAKAKRENPELNITVFERSHYISYSACGMPYFLEGKVPRRSLLISRTPGEMAQDGIEVKTRHEVVSVDPEAKEVTVRHCDTGAQFTKDYDKLVLATGASAARPDLSGIELGNIFTLRRIEDVEALREALDEGAKRAVIVGGGYIGLELAEALREVGLEVTLVEGSDRLLNTFDPELSEIVFKTLQENGVTVHLDKEVQGFSGDEKVAQVELENESVETDLVVVAVGARPNNALAKALELDLGPSDAILVDAQLQTSRKDIYAVGDVTAVQHLVSDESAWLPLGDTANQQARILGQVLAGQEASFQGVVGSVITKVFDRAFAKTGLSTKEALDAGLEAQTHMVSATDRAGYYPGKAPIHIQLIWQKETQKLLGAQIAAQDLAAKRIDVFAALLHFGATLKDISALDLAYAPPFSGALDAVIVAANVARSKA